jgi:hypothetical protein
LLVVARSRFLILNGRGAVLIAAAAIIAACHRRGAGSDECRAGPLRPASERIARAGMNDSALQQASRGGLVVAVRGTVAQSPTSPAPTIVRLRALSDTSAQTFRADRDGIVRALSRVSGLQQLYVHALGYRPSIDSISVRVGYVDTIEVRPVIAPMCLTGVKVD